MSFVSHRERKDFIKPQNHKVHKELRDVRVGKLVVTKGAIILAKGDFPHNPLVTSSTPSSPINLIPLILFCGFTSLRETGSVSG
jgi:hypothetical protein